MGNAASKLAVQAVNRPVTGPTANDRKRALAAERQRRCRARRRASILVKAEMERFGFVEALVETGRLGQWDEDDREAIDDAVTTLLADWHVSVTRDGADPIASVIMRRRREAEIAPGERETNQECGDTGQ